MIHNWYKNIFKKPFIVLVFTIILIIIVVVLFIKPQQWNRVLFLDTTNVNDIWMNNLYMMDGDGNRMQLLINNVDGPPAWSNEGKLIAVGCLDHICIIDGKLIINYRSYPLPYDENALVINEAKKIIKTISLPNECLSLEKSGFNRIMSLSWSRDSKKLAVVCGGITQSIVCIISLDDQYYCWDDNIVGFTIERAVWSPVSDSLAISGGQKIQNMLLMVGVLIILQMGKNLHFLVMLKTKN
jgi:hypothetical protein